MRFPSKKDRWIAIVMWGSAAFGIGVSIAAGSWWAVALMVVMWSFFGWLWFTTDYTVDGDRLRIRSGPIKQTIAIDEIVSVRATRNPLSSMALSLDRLEIRYGRRFTLISPLDREGFIQALQDRNASIEVKR